MIWYFYPQLLYMSEQLLRQIKHCLDYDSLDYKWLVREYLLSHPLIEGAVRPDPPLALREVLKSLANSSFLYLEEHRRALEADPSLGAIIQLCTDKELETDILGTDEEVFHLSRVFNQIVGSDRKLHKCYDCGTNARAMFLKLIGVHRGELLLTPEEQTLMRLEYRVTYKRVREAIDDCRRRLEDASSNTIAIMSIGIQDFGHVWILEKCFKPKGPIYRHYQSSFRSHLVLDFVEHRNYGVPGEGSIDIDAFFGDLHRIMSVKTAWDDETLRLFTKVFAFLPVSKVTNPNPGFCFTTIVY